MKIILTAMTAIGMALACHAAPAQDLGNDVTVTQQGIGNTAYAEQANSNPTYGGMHVTITQIGNDNHVGGPGASGGGVRQFENLNVNAVIRQEGTGNNAGITQTRNFGPVYPAVGQITQTGSNNSAMLRQYESSDLLATIEQRGTGNIANVDQTGATAQLMTIQNGVNNRVTIDYANGPYGGPSVRQDGEGNTATVYGDGVSLGGGPDIRQTGSFNSVTTTQILASDSTSQIRQQGIGNQADMTQTGNFQGLSIDQSGNGNLASISQTGISTGSGNDSNSAVIAQLGNSNTAIVRQAGQDYVANVSQVGSNNYTSIYQH